MTEAKDPNGHITQYGYNAGTGLLETIAQDPAGINAVTHMTHDGNGYVDAVTDPNGKTTHYTYDALGWLNQATDPLGRLTKYTYDANGNVTKLERQASLTPTWQSSNFTYTRLNHVKTVTDPLGRVTTYAYDDNENVKTVTDNNAKSTNYVYDERDLLLSITDANAGVTRYDYDINGKLAKIMDAKSQATQYSYDALNRLTGRAGLHEFRLYKRTAALIYYALQFRFNHHVTSVQEGFTCRTSPLISINWSNNWYYPIILRKRRRSPSRSNPWPPHKVRTWPPSMMSTWPAVKGRARTSPSRP